jgi:hypothetical protein
MVEIQRIAIIPFVLDQQQILFWNRRVGYCGIGPNQPVTFLTGAKDQCALRDDEKRDVIRYVVAQLGSVKSTSQTERFLENDEWATRPNQEVIGAASDD